MTRKVIKEDTVPNGRIEAPEEPLVYVPRPHAQGSDAMDSPINTRHEPCPSCKGKRLTEVMAVIPMLNDFGDVILPHCYCICVPCHKVQFVKKYTLSAYVEPNIRDCVHVNG